MKVKPSYLSMIICFEFEGMVINIVENPNNPLGGHANYLKARIPILLTSKTMHIVLHYEKGTKIRKSMMLMMVHC